MATVDASMGSGWYSCFLAPKGWLSLKHCLISTTEKGKLNLYLILQYTYIPKRLRLFNGVARRLPRFCALLSPASSVLPSDVMADGEIAMAAWLDLANGT
jgi:hypothetical protein